MNEGFFGPPRLNRRFDSNGCEIDPSGNKVNPNCSGGGSRDRNYGGNSQHITRNRRRNL